MGWGSEHTLPKLVSVGAKNPQGTQKVSRRSSQLGLNNTQIQKNLPNCFRETLPDLPGTFRDSVFFEYVCVYLLPRSKNSKKTHTKNTKKHTLKTDLANGWRTPILHPGLPKVTKSSAPHPTVFFFVLLLLLPSPPSLSRHPRGKMPGTTPSKWALGPLSCFF